MRYELIDYQREAAIVLVERLRLARDLWASSKIPSSFALSAITGAGKTVIAAAVIEALIHGSSDLGAEADPKATFLWITDDPALNRQTRNKMLDSSDLLLPKTLIEVDEGFLEEELTPRRLYFLNTQKLSKTSRLVQSATNQRQLSFWEVLVRTINGEKANLYLILDEAHRGMKRAADRTTIVQRLIHGEKGSNPAVPVVWGISATIDRFTKAMGETKDRTVFPHIIVDVERVRASGLVKDAIGLDQPDEKGTFSTTLLRDAVKATRDFESRWTTYCDAEGEPKVLPVLVIQVPDKSDVSKIGEVVQVVESEWPGLGPNAIAHVFGEHEPVVLGWRTIGWVPPESIQTEDSIRVVLAKEAISTGWDCPRAEVLYSERPAKDATHIAQVIGRMVRQPLAHRIATDDALNSVTCYLPLFDRKALSSIKNELEGKGAENGDTKVGPEVVRDPRVFEWNPTIAREVFQFIETLPSIPTPDILADPLRRAKSLVRLLADDVTGRALLKDADALLTRTLNARLDGLAAEHAAEVRANVADIRTVEVHTSKVTTTGQDTGNSSRQIATHAKDIDRDTRKIINSVKEGVGKAYYAYRIGKSDSTANKLDVRVEVAALFLGDGVVAEIEATATKFVRGQLAKFEVEIKNTTGATRDAYRRVQEQTTSLEPLTIELRNNEKAPTKNGEGEALPSFGGHIYSDRDGKFPAQLNQWEEDTVRAEVARPSFVAWYRNPQRATPNALRIPYQDEAGKWSSLQIDFLIVSRRDDGTLAASIVDPHGDHLADARAKLRALADFADRYGERFLRISSVAEAPDGTLRSLDLMEPEVRDAVRNFKGGKVSALYSSEHATPFK
ncbi:MAG: DEAD/DEAH box helicase family protein [Spirochaetes bacterium]|nr:DEAD/DEAH box helicase family protein [Spirochaetota bacterium]